MFYKKKKTFMMLLFSMLFMNNAKEVKADIIKDNENATLTTTSVSVLNEEENVGDFKEKEIFSPLEFDKVEKSIQTQENIEKFKSLEKQKQNTKEVEENLKKFQFHKDEVKEEKPALSFNLLESYDFYFQNKENFNLNNNVNPITTFTTKTNMKEFLVDCFQKVKNSDVTTQTTVTSIFKGQIGQIGQISQENQEEQSKVDENNIPTYDYVVNNVISKDKSLCAYTYKNKLGDKTYTINLVDGKVYFYEKRNDIENMFVCQDYNSFFKDMILNENSIVSDLERILTKETFENLYENETNDDFIIYELKTNINTYLLYIDAKTNTLVKIEFVDNLLHVNTRVDLIYMNNQENLKNIENSFLIDKYDFEEIESNDMQMRIFAAAFDYSNAED